MDVSEVVQCKLEFFHRFGYEFLGLGQVVGVVGLLIADPLEAVELVVMVLDLAEGEALPATFHRVGFAPLRVAVRVAAVALLEL